MSMFTVHVYSKGSESKHIDSFILTADGFAAAQVEAAQEVRTKYTNAYVGKVEKL